MGCEYLEKIKEICKNMMDQYSNDSWSTYSSIMNNGFNEFNTTIKSFFVGKESEVREIYNIIRTNAMPYNRIKCLDVNLASNMYSDYLPGMLEFINKVVDLHDTDNVDIDRVIGICNKVKEKDTEFVDSLFEGIRVKVDEYDIDSAMQNVELLIGMDNYFNDTYSTVSTVVNTATNNTSEKYKDVIGNALQVLVVSLTRYTYKYINEILSTYDKIHNSIQNRTPVGGEKVIPEYQVF